MCFECTKASKRRGILVETLNPKKLDKPIGIIINDYIRKMFPDQRERIMMLLVIAQTIKPDTGKYAVEAAFWAGIDYAINNPDKVIMEVKE